jgi:protein arginine kinase
MVVIGDKEMISIMVNEEDHIRIYGMDSGLQLSQTWHLVDKVDDELNAHIDYAVSPDWGYLTACPTNVGTGMRASVMIHLPALTLTKQINKVLKAVSQLGLTIRGLYGEGTEALGNLFQISNQVTLGQKEEEIADNIERVTRQIIGHEEKAERLLLREAKEQIEDKVFRAYATLRYARVISTQEAIDLLSTVRLGVSMQILKGIKLSVLNELLVMIQPAHVQKISGATLQPPQRDVKRAELIRKKFS